MAKKQRKQQKKTPQPKTARTPNALASSEDAGHESIASLVLSSDDERSTTPAHESAQTTGNVRKSTLYIAVGIALAAGLYLGTLLPGLMGISQNGPATQPTQQAQQAQQTQQAKQQEADHLAGHILEMEERVRKNPDDLDAWVRLGNLYFDSGKPTSAINAYERALILKPDNPDVLTDMGIMYRETGKYDMAVESFRKASLINPRHQNALFNRGVVLYFDLARKDEARAVWQELLTLNPNAAAPNGKPLKDMLRELQ